MAEFIVTLCRLLQSRPVEGHLWMIGSCPPQRSQNLESNHAIGHLEQLLLQHERGLVGCKLADGVGDVPADVLRHVAIAERDVEHAERLVAVLEKCQPRIVAHLPLTEHQEQRWAGRKGS